MELRNDTSLVEIDINKITREFLFQNNEKALKLQLDDEHFFIKVKVKEYNNKLIVFSNGAVNLSQKKPPVFMREKWSEEIDANCLYIDDKTIHGHGLSLGWGIGTSERFYLQDYSKIITKIMALLYIPNEQLYFFGSSAGGFMSIALATIMKKGIAIVNNPQTNVLNYYKSAVDPLFSKVFKGLEKDDILDDFKIRFNLVDLITHYNYIPNTVYLQNRLCKFDMDNHLEPFFEELSSKSINTENINIILYNNKLSQHSPMHKDKTVPLINNYINKNTVLLN